MDTPQRRYCPECFREFTGDEEVCPEHNAALISLPPDESLVGRVVDHKYEILEEIGSGGMGKVYKARQKLIGRVVALKVLRADFAKDVNAVKRFFVEARAAAELRSRNSVILFDFGLSGENLLFYTMEMLDGAPLGAILRSEGPLEVNRALKIAIDVCHSIEEAHDLGIVHRDLKPDNIQIVLDKEGDELAKVLDFGIAKLLTQGDSTALTQTGMICGTPEYMSPEQATAKDIGPSSDLYSLGIVMYEMLSGAPPFKESTPVLILMQHVNRAPRAVSTMAPQSNIPLELDRLLFSLLAKEEERRPPSAKHLRKSLETILKGGSSAGDTREMRLISVADHDPQPQGTDEQVYEGGEEHKTARALPPASPEPAPEQPPGPGEKSTVKLKLPRQPATPASKAPEDAKDREPDGISDWFSEEPRLEQESTDHMMEQVESFGGSKLSLVARLLLLAVLAGIVGLGYHQGWLFNWLPEDSHGTMEQASKTGDVTAQPGPLDVLATGDAIPSDVRPQQFDAAGDRPGLDSEKADLATRDSLPDVVRTEAVMDAPPSPQEVEREKNQLRAKTLASEGEQLQKRGKYSRAIERYRQAKQLDSALAAVLDQRIGECKKGIQKWKRKKRKEKEALASQLVKEAKALMKVRHFEDALAKLSQGADLVGRNAEIRGLEKQCKQGLKDKKKDDVARARQLLKEARALVKVQRYLDAMLKLAEAEELIGKTEEIKRLERQCRRGMGDKRPD